MQKFSSYLASRNTLLFHVASILKGKAFQISINTQYTRKAFQNVRWMFIQHQSARSFCFVISRILYLAFRTYRLFPLKGTARILKRRMSLFARFSVSFISKQPVTVVQFWCDSSPFIFFPSFSRLDSSLSEVCWRNFNKFPILVVA